MTQATVPEKIGREYVESDTLPAENSAEVRDAYRKIARINDVRYEQIPVPVVWQEDDPYSDFQDMKESVEREGVFRVFSGGTHPTGVLSREENIKGRAVHDWYGHLAAECDFSFSGEFTKWRHVRDAYPPECAPVLFAEVVGQVSAAYYLEGGFSNDRFTQRPCAAPARWIDAAREFSLE